MKHTEILRNTILVFVVVLLAISLYRRLLTVLRKDSVGQDYPSLGNAIKWLSTRHALIEVHVKRGTNLKVEVYRANGELITTLAEEAVGNGDYTFELDASSYSPGRYYYKVSSDKQQASQYFEVE